jgi:hypothetical protein
VENYEIQCQVVSVFVALLKYTRSHEEIIKVVNEEIYEKNFYYKRVYLVFFEEAIRKYSIGYIVELGVLDKAVKLFDSGVLLTGKLITLLPDYYTQLPDDKRKVVNERVKHYSQEIDEGRIRDTELNKGIAVFTRWREEHYEKHTDIIVDLLRKESDKCTEENRIRELIKPKEYVDNKRIEDSKKFLKRINNPLVNSTNNPQIKVRILLILATQYTKHMWSKFIGKY